MGSILVLWGGAGVLAGEPDSPSDGPLNVVLFVGDDLRWDSLCTPGAGLPSICSRPARRHPLSYVERTLVAKGVVFSEAYASTPLCCPARAGLLSGGYFAHHTNVLSNQPPDGGMSRFADSDTLATRLQEHGYATALLGKYLNQYAQSAPYVPPGWSHFIGQAGGGATQFHVISGTSTYNAPGVGTRIDISGTHLTDYLAAESLDFINQQCPGGVCVEPFFLSVNFGVPHAPATPCERHESQFSNFVYRERGYAELPDGDLTDKPFYVQEAASEWDEEAEDLFHKDYLRSLRCMDEAIEGVLGLLRDRGLLNQTVIIFTGDHGLMWGEHFLDKKTKPYEESVRLPLVIRHPAFGPAVIDRLVTFDLDLAPTILEIAGLDGSGADGTSLLGLMADPGGPWRDALLLEAFADEGLPAWAAIRTDDGLKYVEYVTGEKELYDLTVDPYELSSKHADPAYALVMRTLAERLAGLERGLSHLSRDLPNPQLPVLPDATIGLPYAWQLRAWGGDGDYTWTLFQDNDRCDGDLPGGLSLTTAGLVTGVATADPGVYSFCIKVADGTLSPQPGNPRTQESIKPLNLEVVLP
jgi:arylsulfatase A-like enzyme